MADQSGSCTKIGNCIDLIVIDSDEESPSAMKDTTNVTMRCINNNCHNTAMKMEQATSFEILYYSLAYGVKDVHTEHSADAFICCECRLSAQKYLQNADKAVRIGRCLLDDPIPRKYEEIVLDDDNSHLRNTSISVSTLSNHKNNKSNNTTSDFSTSTNTMIDSKSLSSKSIADYPHAINKKIDNTLDLLNLNYQLDLCFNKLNNIQDSLSDKQSKLESDCKKLQDEFDAFYTSVFVHKRPVNMSLEVDLDKIDDQVLTDIHPASDINGVNLLSSSTVATVSQASHTPTHEKSPEVDIIMSRLSSRSPNAKLPKPGVLKRRNLQVNQEVLAMYSDLLSPWFIGKIINVFDYGKDQRYEVKFNSMRNRQVSADSVVSVHLSAASLAYTEPAVVRLSIGERVVATCRIVITEKPLYCLCAGIIAEAPHVTNSYRYLVFFDNGHTQYVTHCDLMPVCAVSAQVWMDVHPSMSTFIQRYLTLFPERAMLRLRPNQTIKVHFKGTWRLARVITIDCSLVLMQYMSSQEREWLYRGSTRLQPMFTQMQSTLQPHRLGVGTRIVRNSRPEHRICVEYNSGYSLTHAASERAINTHFTQPVGAVTHSEPHKPRAVARKSCARQSRSAVVSRTKTASAVSDAHPPAKVALKSQPQGQIVHVSPKCPKGNVYVNHTCSVKCKMASDSRVYTIKHTNPFLLPIMFSWQRNVVKYGPKEIVVFYTAPCGRRFRTIGEIHSYLCLINSTLHIDFFCFDSCVNIYAQYRSYNIKMNIKDISYGRENYILPCVNEIDDTKPDSYIYNTRRVPTEGVHLNLDPEFLVCCDCTDGCTDKSKCACCQLTIQGTSSVSSMQQDAGYTYRRLLNGPVCTGIYECNSRCKCNSQCLNRVVQHPLSKRLQLFKTTQRGWGIRTLDDIAKGAFICIYAGQILTESAANEDGKNYGDEYLAELDFIEVVECMKEGYESGADLHSGSDDDTHTESSDSDSTENRGYKQDLDFFPSSHKRIEKIHSVFGDEFYNRAKRQCTVISENSASVQSSQSSDVILSDNKAAQSVRRHFGENEFCYILDAKNNGNLGRYLNHSCTPNVFVQNVFVDTHDLRFPWIAFFALTHISAGTELTWDYSYEIDSVPGKVMYCYCGSKYCRGRLL